MTRLRHRLSGDLFIAATPEGRRLFTLGPLDHWLTGGLRAHALADLVFLALADLVPWCNQALPKYVDPVIGQEAMLQKQPKETVPKYREI